ncbi:polyadenylate-binding protein 2-like protein, partial [Tanacetum coccineum]
LEHKHGDKVTEMILELDTSEVLYLLESPNELKLVVDEAMDVLRNGFVSALVNASPYIHRMVCYAFFTSFTTRNTTFADRQKVSGKVLKSVRKDKLASPSHLISASRSSDGKGLW